MHVLFVIDPLPQLKAYKDSSVAMMQALAARGHTLSVALQADLYIEAGIVRVRAMPIALVPGADLHEHAWWRESGPPVEAPLKDFGAVLMRKDPPFDLEYVAATYILERAEDQGALVANKPRSLRDCNEKMFTAWFPQCTPPTLFSRDMSTLRAFHAEHHDVIYKPVDGMGGSGIFRVGSDGLNLGAVLEQLTRNGQTTIVAQRYLPAIKDGDKRILMVDGEPVPYCLARVPMAGETRGNLAAGGSGRPQPLTERDRWIAAQVGPRLKELGLLFVGLDVIGEHLTEINVTSPTCAREIDKAYGTDIGGQLIAALEQRLASR